MALRLVTTLSTSTSAVSVELVLLVSTPSLSLSVSSTSPSKIFLNVFSVWSSKKDDQFCLSSIIRIFFLFYSFFVSYVATFLISVSNASRV